MREIKFRAWDKVNKQMGKVLGLFFAKDDVDSQAQIVFEWEDKKQYHWRVRILSFKDIDLEQFTGLKDKNGVEIYINDEYKWYQPLVENGKQIRKEHRTIVKDDIVELFYLHNRTEN